MNDHESQRHAAGEATAGSFARRLRRWWRFRDADEKYLAEAADLAGRKRRLGVRKRVGRGPAFVTFNH